MEPTKEASPLTFSGLASGLKTDEIVPAMVEKSRGPLRKVEQHQEVLESHQELIETLHSVVLTLGDQAHKLDASHKFIVQRANSSNEDVVGATAGVGAARGSYRVEIEQLAKAQKSWSRTFDQADGANDVGVGKLSWMHNDARVELEVGEGTTLLSLAEDINRRRAGVGAHVVFDGRQHRLQIEGQKTGAVGSLQLQEEGLGLGLDLAENIVRDAADAKFNIDGHLAMTREENVVHDAIQGVTLVLEQEGEGALIRVAPDPDAMVEAVAQFVDSYNITIDAVDLASKPSRDFERGRMVGDASLRNMHRALQDAVTSPVKNLAGPYTSLSQIGISSSKDGRLRMDTSKLRELIRQHPDEVARLFARDRVGGSVGVAVVTQNVVDHYTLPLTGVLPGKLQSISRQHTANDARITQMSATLEKYESHLREQFSNLERNMTKMKNQKEFLEQQMRSMSSGR